MQTKTKKQIKADEVAESKARLIALLPKGSTVYTIIRHVSSSGMSRDISPIVFVDGSPLYLAYHVAKVLECTYKVSRGHDAVHVNGCGMDMCFWLVYSLGQAIHGDGYALRSEIL